jgi:tetratricopeptide (TPR) repeat protein
MSDKLPEQRDYTISPDLYIAIGNRQSQIGRDFDALAAYDRAVRLAPNYARAYNYRGSFKYARLGDLQGAIADFDSAIGYDPDYATAYANRGLLRYQQLGDIPGALADLNLAIVLNPGDASVYNTRGLIKYGELGDIEYALTGGNAEFGQNSTLRLKAFSCMVCKEPY